MTIHSLFGLEPGRRQVISLCGAGGKSTLMLALARESRKLAPTALFTTTHIRRPEEEDVALPEPFEEQACRAAFAKGLIVAAGQNLPLERRFGPPEEAVVAFLCREARCVYIEADGSRCLPLKYPNAWEPVLRPETTHVLVVAGLTALDQPVETALHRLELARQKMDIPETHVTEELMARTLWAGYGAYRPIFFLNQADTPAQQERGEKTAALLRELGAERVAVASLRTMLNHN